MIELRLPWPPSVNDYWGSFVPPGTRTVRRFLTEKAKKFREDVGWLVIQAGRPRFAADAEILLDITLHPPTRQRRDADNFNKGVWDALEHAEVFADDAQVQSYRVTKGAVVSGGAVIVKIWQREVMNAESQGSGETQSLFAAEAISR